MSDKSVGQLIDELCIVNLKIWHLIDVIESNTNDKEVAEAARKTAKLNRDRSKLVNQIDEIIMGEGRIIKV